MLLRDLHVPLLKTVVSLDLEKNVILRIPWGCTNPKPYL